MHFIVNMDSFVPEQFESILSCTTMRGHGLLPIFRLSMHTIFFLNLNEGLLACVVMSDRGMASNGENRVQ